MVWIGGCRDRRHVGSVPLDVVGIGAARGKVLIVDDAVGNPVVVAIRSECRMIQINPRIQDGDGKSRAGDARKPRIAAEFIQTDQTTGFGRRHRQLRRRNGGAHPGHVDGRIGSRAGQLNWTDRTNGRWQCGLDESIGCGRQRHGVRDGPFRGSGEADDMLAGRQVIDRIATRFIDIRRRWIIAARGGMRLTRIVLAVIVVVRVDDPSDKSEFRCSCLAVAIAIVPQPALNGTLRDIGQGDGKRPLNFILAQVNGMNRHVVGLLAFKVQAVALSHDQATIDEVKSAIGIIHQCQRVRVDDIRVSHQNHADLRTDRRVFGDRRLRQRDGGWRVVDNILDRYFDLRFRRHTGVGVVNRSNANGMG